MLNYINDHRNYLFHYTKWETAKEKIFKKSAIRFSPFICLDDPREYKDWTFDVLPSHPCREFIEYMKEIKNKANSLIKNYYKVLCFTETPRIEKRIVQNAYDFRYRVMFLMGYARARMWSHHADDHKGICLVFDKKKLLSFIKKKYPTSYCGPVRYKNYSDDFLKARKIYLDRMWTDEKIIIDTLKEHIRKNRQSIFFEKNVDYRDEREYRVIIHGENPGYEEIPVKDLLCGAIVNADKYDTYSSYLNESAQYLNFKIGTLYWQEGRPVIYGSAQE